MEKGEFIDDLDWNDPLFAPYRLPDFEQLNAKQRWALLDDDDLLDNATKLTEEDYKAMCLKIPQHVDLSRGQVCIGVEKSWPKRCFGKNSIDELNSKEKRYIYSALKRKGIDLYNKYVNKERIKKRKTNSIEDALQYYYEEKYRRGLYERICELEAEVSQTDPTAESDEELSVITVIDTQNDDSPHQEVNSKGNQSAFDENYNDMSNINDENVANNLQVHDESQNHGKVRNQGERQPLSQHKNIRSNLQNNGVQKMYDEDDIDDGDVLIFPDDEDRMITIESDAIKYNDILTQTTTTTTEEDQQTEDGQSEDRPSSNPFPEFGTQELNVNAPAIDNLQEQRMNIQMDDQNSEEPDSLEFLAPVLDEARTSTQN